MCIGLWPRLNVYKSYELGKEVDHCKTVMQ